jgi:1,2-diacylglycerol 3-alpha-glucosyltransferase
MVKLKTIVFVHPFLLHYHFPRLHALAEECRRAQISFYNITLASYVDIYRSLMQDKEEKFNNIVLFPGQNLEYVPEKRIRSSLKQELNQLQPDVVFLYGYSDGAMRQAKSWAEKRNAATVLISDSNEFDRPRNKVFEFVKSLLVSRYDAALVGGSNSSSYLQRLGIPAARIVSGYDVIDNEFFRQQASKNRQSSSQIRQKWNLPEDYFLFVGRLVKSKNIRGLLHAYAEYVNLVHETSTPLSLVICGSGPEEKGLHEYVGNMPSPFGKQILFYGLIKQPELTDFYSCASCFILPSLPCESWGLVVNEALACGLPAIVSNKCGCSLDLVSDGINGWLFDPFNSGELASRMLQFHTLDPASRAEMGLRGEEIISQWGLETFSRNALKCAGIAVEHRNRS